MAYREVTMVEVKEVLRQWLAGGTRKRIAARLGLAPKTVRRYLRTAERLGLVQAAGEAALTDEWLATLMSVLTTVPPRPHGAAWPPARRTRRSFARTSSAACGSPRFASSCGARAA